MHRRALLAATAAGLGTLAGCSVLGSSDGSSGPPVYGEGPDNPEHRLRLTVEVLEEGEALADEQVIYHDFGGSYDKLEGTTNGDGKLVFVDSMGPPPCNPVAVEVPDHDAVSQVGCHNGGKEISHTVDVTTADDSL